MLGVWKGARVWGVYMEDLILITSCDSRVFICNFGFVVSGFGLGVCIV